MPAQKVRQSVVHSRPIHCREKDAPRYQPLKEEAHLAIQLSRVDSPLTVQIRHCSGVVGLDENRTAGNARLEPLACKSNGPQLQHIYVKKFLLLGPLPLSQLGPQTLSMQVSAPPLQTGV